MYFLVQSVFVMNFVILICKTVGGTSSLSKEQQFWRNTNLRSNRISGKNQDDGILTTSKLIEKYKYNAETHYVTTEDGYILGVHRIPKPGGQPVLLQHGLIDSSATFIIMGPGKSLGYLLSDYGYDVWLGNSRGNRYSRNHTTLNADDSKFWEFSWHEMGIYDLPATIDHILNVTGFEKLYYVGHSQGSTIFFVMCSKRPEYNEKISLMQGLAPAVFLSRSKTPYRPLFNFLMNYIRLLPTGEILPYGFLKRTPCFTGNIFELLCIEGFFTIVGRDAEQFNNSFAHIIFSHAPAGSSVRQFQHFLQLFNSGLFAEYNFGDEENLKRYGQVHPPKYNLSLVTADVVLHYGLNDYLVDYSDVTKLYKVLQNGRGVYQAPRAQFNHIDFLWSTDVIKLANRKILSIMKKFAAGTLEYVIE